MRDSYFSSDVNAIVEALRERVSSGDAEVDTGFGHIRSSLERLLEDERSPEREWRRRIAIPLRVLAEAMRSLGAPINSIERLATEMSL